MTAHRQQLDALDTDAVPTIPAPMLTVNNHFTDAHGVVFGGQAFPYSQKDTNWLITLLSRLLDEGQLGEGVTVHLNVR